MQCRYAFMRVLCFMLLHATGKRPAFTSRGVALAVISTDLMTIRDINCSEDDTPVSFEGIPPEWEIKKDMLKLHCIEGKPIELGRGGCGVVLYGDFYCLAHFLLASWIQSLP